MKQYIRYLYEYENGKRIRNVGFVRVEEDDRTCIIHIHGKGLRLKAQTDMEVYVFYKNENNACMGIRQGEIKNVNPSINYRLEYGHDDVGGAERFGEIEGIILSNYSRPKYAAVWNDAPADIENMVVVEKEANFPETPAPEQQMQSGSGSANSDIATSEEETNEEPENLMMPEVAASEEKMPEPEHRVEMVSESMPEAEAEAEPEPELREQMMPMPESNYHSTIVMPMPEADNDEPAATVIPMPEPDNNESSAVTSDAKEAADENEQEEEGIKFQKITREEIARLPRREWRLANNSFLLHGYYNYNHLVIMEEGENIFLGVPGIYHAKEKPAAEAFGFGNFVKWSSDKLELTDEEHADGKDFGYWYRQVSRSKVQ